MPVHGLRGNTTHQISNTSTTTIHGNPINLRLRLR